MHVIAIGVDTETCKGKPFSFQFFSKELELEQIRFIKHGEASKQFFQFLDSLPATRDRHYVLFGHNLSFDMVSFFYDRHTRLREESITGETWHGWKVEIVYAAVRFATFTKARKRITMIDTGAFFVTTLAKLAEIFCPHLPKLNAPAGLGQRIFTRKNRQFCKYAMRDSEIAYYVGLFLLDKHREFDISLCVSGPHFASKVFRRHYIKKTIPLPPRKVVYAALSAYHGGKNNITVKTGIYKKVVALDIKSAYPYAMAGFPSFSNPDLYKAISGDCHPSGPLPPFGIYKISGTAKPCKCPIIYSHNFKPIHGDFDGIWTTGFEVNEALRLNEVRITSVRGYFYDAKADNEPSPFRAYVEEFYARKESAKEKAQREFNKLLMNALYGKFIQTRGIVGMNDLTFDTEENKLILDASIQAGGLFNPFIAALITGHTRAYIHRLEHDFNAIHTSTDGIQTQEKVSNKRLAVYGKQGNLGSVSIESAGDALIMRNKLYIIYGGRITRNERKTGLVKESQLFRGRKIIKSALHGFHGDVFTLERLYKTGTRDYEYVKVNKLRESIKRKLQVNDFVTTKATLKLESDAG